MKTDQKIYLERLPNGDLKKVITTIQVEEVMVKVSDLVDQRDKLIQDREAFIESVVKVELFKFEQKILATNEQILQAKKDGVIIDDKVIKEINNEK